MKDLGGVFWKRLQSTYVALMAFGEETTLEELKLR